MTRTANTIYERDDLIKQAKKEIKPGISFSLIAYTIFLAFALVVDYMSIAPFQDLVLRTNATIAKALSVSIVFCIDVLIPISLTKLVKAHFKQNRLNLILIFAILFSIGIPLLLMIIQKMLGTNIMIPDRGTTAVITHDVKIVTQLLFSFVPLATTVGLTVMGLLRENIKIFRKYRYLQLAEARVEAELDHIEEAIESDVKTLRERDDSKFASGVTELFAMRDTLFSKARELLAMSLRNPAATEKILNSKPVYCTSKYYEYVSKYLIDNPALRVEFEKDEKSKTTASTVSNGNVSIFEKEDIHHEKESA